MEASQIRVNKTLVPEGFAMVVCYDKCLNAS
jgi:hypothetical protein